MELKENNFYIIKDEFFSKYQSTFLLDNKKEKRPHFFLIADKLNKDIYWVIPMSRQLDKALKKIQDRFNNDEKKCPYYVINTSAKKSVFVIGNSFPILKKYIKREFLLDSKPLELKDTTLLKKIYDKFDSYLNYSFIYSKNPIIKNLRNDLIQEIKIDKINKIQSKVKDNLNEILKINKEIDNKNEKSDNLKSLITKFEKLEDKYYQVKEKKEEFNNQPMLLKLFLRYKLSSLNYDLKSITEQKEKLEKSSGFSLATAKSELLLNEKEISSLASKRNEMLKEKSSLEKEYNQLQVNNQNNSNTNNKKIENVENNTLNLKR